MTMRPWGRSAGIFGQGKVKKKTVRTIPVELHYKELYYK